MPYAACLALFTVLGLALPGLSFAGEPLKARARDLGIPFDGVPGPLNAITDVGEIGRASCRERV